METLLMPKKMLGDTIYRLRTERGLSRSKLAELVGVDVNYVIKWETYKECPNINLIPLLDQLLEKSKEGTDSDLYLYYYDFVTGGI
jgi:transcriptional regulator with XRE-family HTH domain